MLETKVKFLASIYTVVLMMTIGSLLVFGGFSFSPKIVKGATIQATMVDISQLKPRKKPQAAKTNKPKNIKPEVEPEIKPVEKQPVIKTPPKKIPPKVIKKTPKIDTKKLERERKKQKERERKKEELRKRKIENKKRLERAEQDLKDLANKVKQEDETPPVENIGSIDGTVEANERNQLAARYQAAVISSVIRQWNKPVSANKNLLCHVKVKQIPGGGVIDATISSPCNANSIVKKSILAAIKKADPLPYKGFESVFDRNANFIFQPRD